MSESTATETIQEFSARSSRDTLEELLHEGARRMLAEAIEAEVSEYINARRGAVDEEGRRLVVRNGYLPERSIQTPVGDVPVRQPRVRDHRPVEEKESFSSKILPPYLRKTRSIEELIPWLYLKGVSTGDFTEALQALLGEQAAGLSATTVTRLKASWKTDYEDWSKRSLAGRRFVYVWADGVYFNVRLESPEAKKQCILVLMGATPEGRKELIAILDGYRESEASWTELLVDLKRRGLSEAPALAIGDGALGFWAALRKIFPTTRCQRCWVHKTANVLNKLPKSVQPRAKGALHEIWQAETRDQAHQAFDAFVEAYEAKYPKATECLDKDREELLVFYDFPAEHWIHLRTTNPIESTFATVKLRTRKTKGAGSRLACLTMVFKLAQSAEKKWRVLNGAKLIPDVMQGVCFVDGLKQAA
jgi:transposase-like protein